MNFTLNETVVTNSTFECEITVGNFILLSGYAILFIIGTLGNGIVLIVLRKYWRKGPTLELLILYLAVFDLLSSIFTPTLFSYWILTCDKWYLGLFLCKFFPSLVHVLTNLSVGILMVMAIDRYRAIASPMKRRFRRKSVHAIAMVTLCLSVAWEIPYIYYLDTSYGTCGIYVENYIYPSITLLIIRDVVFICIMIFSIVGAYVALNESDHELYLRECHSHDNRLSQRNKHVIIMLIWMAILSIVSILPRDLFHLTYALSYFTKAIPYTDTTILVNASLRLLQTSNSIYNVFIYAGKHNHFWNDVLYLFCRKIYRGNRTSTHRTNNRASESKRLSQRNSALILLKSVNTCK